MVVHAAFKVDRRRRISVSNFQVIVLVACVRLPLLAPGRRSCRLRESGRWCARGMHISSQGKKVEEKSVGGGGTGLKSPPCAAMSYKALSGLFRSTGGISGTLVVLPIEDKFRAEINPSDGDPESRHLDIDD